MKGQVAIEFMIIFIFMLLLMIGAVAIANKKTLETHSETMDLEAEKVLYKASSAVNTAYIEGDGFGLNFVLPEGISGTDYSINISSNAMWLSLGAKTYAGDLLTDDIAGEMVYGANTVENRGGIVYVNP
ncbi:MAG: hypothetical protein ABIH90_01570 [Candidatus Aenigmatarchaeota archaeon]